MAYREKRRWTLTQEQYIIENCHRLTDEEIADQLGKTKRAVTTKRQRLEMKKACGRGICKLADE